MAIPQTDPDSLVTGFEADDEFAAPADRWQPEAEPAKLLDDDDAYLTPQEPIESFDAEETAPARGAAPNPVGDLIAGAEALLGEASVPHIGIHIFWETSTTQEVAEKCAADRRMARASTEIKPGGLAAAIAQYQNQPTPPLIIVESESPPSAMLGQLDQLAQVCDAGAKVVVIGAHNDITLYRELVRRGVSEYLVPPLQPLQLIGAITTLYADPSAPFVGRQIAFVGARGGVGSSTVAHNLAYLLSETMRTNTVIVDLDLPFGTAGLDFNQDPLQGIADALSQPDRLDQVLLDRMMARCGERLSLFAAPATLDTDYDISAEAFEEVASKIRATAPYVVLDLPHLWCGWMRRMLLSADDVVITASPDLASLRNAKNIVDLVRQARPNDTPPMLVLNLVGAPGRPEIPVKDFGEALGIDIQVVIPFDAKLFGQAANNGQMIDEIGPRSKAAEALQRLSLLVTRRDPPPAQKKSALSGLFKFR